MIESSEHGWEPADDPTGSNPPLPAFKDFFDDATGRHYSGLHKVLHNTAGWKFYRLPWVSAGSVYEAEPGTSLAVVETA